MNIVTIKIVTMQILTYTVLDYIDNLPQRQHCKNFVGKCGVCLKFKGIKARPPLGPSLVRVAISIKSFQHVLLDPLGHVRVKTHGSSTQKVYPLIMVDISNGETHFELMASLEAKEVYLALNRLQYRYNTKVI